MQEISDAPKGADATATLNGVELKTSLGKCKLGIKANLQDGKLGEAAKLALTYLVFHVIPAKAYAKKESFKRDSAYSPELSAHVKSHALTVLGKIFQDISIEMGEEITLTAEERARRDFVELGLEGDQLESAMKTWKSKNQKPAETVTAQPSEDAGENA